MKIFALVISAAAIAVVAASPAQSTGKHHHKAAAGHARVQHDVAVNSGFQGGVRAGPLYNGQDYIGDDPDPNIRAALIKDQTRYQGSY